MAKKKIVNDGWHVSHEGFLADGYDTVIYRVFQGQWFYLNGTPVPDYDVPSDPWPLRLLTR